MCKPILEMSSTLKRSHEEEDAADLGFIDFPGILKIGWCLHDKKDAGG
jgi:hypothetical protein